MAERFNGLQVYLLVIEVIGVLCLVQNGLPWHEHLFC